MIQKSKRTSLFLRKLWYLVSWAFVAFAIVAVFFLGLLPVLLQPLMEDNLAKIGRESDSARLRYVNPFYVQVDDFGYKTPAFEFSTKKLTVDMNPSDWIACRPGVINVGGYHLNLDFDRLKKSNLDQDMQTSILLKPLEDMAVMFFSNRMYVKDAVLRVGAGDLHQDYLFSLFSRQHDEGHFFSLQTNKYSDSKYKLNGNFSLRYGSGNLNVSGLETSPELWLEALKTYLSISLPVDITFDQGLDFEAQVELVDNDLKKWVLLGGQKGMNITGSDFNAVVDNLSFGFTGSKNQYFQSSLMGDIGSASIYGNDLGNFNFEITQKGDEVYGKIHQVFLNDVLFKKVTAVWAVSNFKEGFPEQLEFKLGDGLVSIRKQNANEYRLCTIDIDSVDLAYLSSVLRRYKDSHMSGKISAHVVLMLSSERLIIKELSIEAPSGVMGSLQQVGGAQEIVFDSLMLDKRGKDLYLKTAGNYNGQHFDMDQSVLHFVPVLKSMLAKKGMQLELD